jgi:acetylornithine deacetylase/succinyl-diaminopimelate desuccinylase-like protein
VAGLFGLLWDLRGEGVRLPGDLWLAANVGEEGLGDLNGMRAVVERFQGQVLAYLILEGMALGQVYHRALAVQRYQVTVRTGGGHSWVDFGSPSAIHELAALITRLAALPLPKNPRTTLNVGIISGGTYTNVAEAPN